MWISLALAGVGGAILLLLAAGQHDQRIIRDWQVVLEPWGNAAQETIVRRARGEKRFSDAAYCQAAAARDRGDLAHAKELLDVGLRLMEASACDWIEVLRGMGLLSRLAAIVLPVPPTTTDLKAGALLVSTRARFGLRLYLLRRSFRIGCRLLTDSTRRFRQAARPADWDRVEAARRDLEALAGATVASFCLLVQSFSARRREWPAVPYRG